MDTYLQYIPNGSENHTEKRLIIISVSFVLAGFEWIFILKAKYALSGVNSSTVKMSYHSCLSSTEIQVF